MFDIANQPFLKKELTDSDYARLYRLRLDILKEAFEELPGTMRPIPAKREDGAPFTLAMAQALENASIELYQAECSVIQREWKREDEESYDPIYNQTREAFIERRGEDKANSNKVVPIDFFRYHVLNTEIGYSIPDKYRMKYLAAFRAYEATYFAKLGASALLVMTGHVETDDELKHHPIYEYMRIINYNSSPTTETEDIAF